MLVVTYMEICYVKVFMLGSVMWSFARRRLAMLRFPCGDCFVELTVPEQLARMYLMVFVSNHRCHVCAGVVRFVIVFKNVDVRMFVMGSAKHYWSPGAL